MKAFKGKRIFSGSWEEDLNNVISVYDTFASMCGKNADEKLNAAPDILKGDALSYLSKHSSSCNSFYDAMSKLRSW